MHDIMINCGNVSRWQVSIFMQWPFCAQLCTYCNFIQSSVDTDNEYLFSCLAKEFESVLSKSSITSFTSLYFGGGTPSLAGAGLVEAVLSTVSTFSRLEGGAEITLEANPSSAQLANLRSFKLAGVTRLSLGIQSLIDDDLKLMNRDHSSKEGQRALENAISVFPGMVNTDMIFGRPEQSFQQWEKELEDMMGMIDNHVSLYQLTVERGTPLAKAVERSEVVMPDEDSVADMYEYTVQRLEEIGLQRYEISNYAKTGYESRHNYSYWTGTDYIGIGPGAHSRYLQRGANSFTRTVNALEPKSWSKKVLAKGDGIILNKELTKIQRLEEVIATCLRTREGLTNEVWNQFSVQPLQMKLKSMGKLKYLLQMDLLELDSRGLRATRKGLNVLDSLLPDVLSQVAL